MTDVDIAALLKNFATDIKEDLKKEIQANADISIRNHEETRKRLDAFGKDLHSVDNKVDVLWRKVHGPNVPPPKSSGEYRLHLDKESASAPKPLAQSVSDHDLSIQSLQAEVKTLTEQVKTSETAAQEAREAAKLAKEEAEGAKKAATEAKSGMTEVKGIAQEVLAMNKEQSQNLGIGVSLARIGEFFVWLKTKQGQRYAATMFAAATSLITAMGTTYALVTKRLPAPTDPVPTVHTVYVQSPGPAPSGSSRHP